MSERFHREAGQSAAQQAEGLATERRLLVGISCAAALIGGAAVAMTELLQDPVTGRWLADGMDRLVMLLSICR